MDRSDRIVSLDVFRGLTIAGMILVNSPGDWSNIYPALEHAKWNGVTPTDLIFPFFLFIVGITTTISLDKRKERGDDQRKLIFQIIKRTVILFLLGLAYSSFPFYNYDFSHIRIPGVLQRIAVVYLISSILFLKTNPRTQAILAVIILFVYWGLLALIPVPGVGYANLEPTTNLGAYLDNLLLHGHLWSLTKVWDPEGILGTIPAISTCLFGILTGYWLKGSNDKTTKAVWIFVWGNIGLVIAVFWDMWFPINKGLWSSSYVVYSAGMALNILGVIYFLVDVKGYTGWIKPFLVYGTNAITVYFLSGIFDTLLETIKWAGNAGQIVTLKGFLYNTLFTPYLIPINASLVWALAYVLFWLGIMWILYCKKIFIKV